MKKLTLALASVLVAGVASAADLPRKSMPSVPVAVPVGMNWSGFYAGLHAGYAFGKSNWDLYANPGNLYVGSGSFDGKGFFGGLQAGYDFQFGNVVAGIAADYSLVGYKGALVAGLDGKINSAGSLRARLGYALSNSTLLYVTGGYALASASLSGAGLVTENKTHGGFVVGAGAEFKLTRNWSAFGEYRYTQYNKQTYSAILAPFAVAAGAKVNDIRVGVNYRF